MKNIPSKKKNTTNTLTSIARLVMTTGLIYAAIGCGRGPANQPLDGFDAQAHRGGRGLMPENTIESEKKTIDLNTTLEMDLQISKDSQVVLSHDAYINADFSLTPEGEAMTKKDGQSRLIFNMPYDSVKKYDVGSKPHPGFKRQLNFLAYKPLLSDLIDSVEAYAKTKGHVNHYNIEIKSSPKADSLHYPSLAFYVSAAMKVIEQKGIAQRTMIQSFDSRALKLIKENYPKMATSYLVSKKDTGSVAHYIGKLGFSPNVFSPEYSLVTPKMVAEFHEKNIKVIPWTVNSLEEMKDLKKMGVDGIISDYPDLFAELEKQ